MPRKRVLFLLVLLVFTFFLSRRYRRNTYQEQFRADLTEACSGSPECLAALRDHFQSCFDKSFHLGFAVVGDTVDSSSFLNCVNRHTGTPVLTE